MVPSKHVNYRYMSTPEKISQMRALRRDNRVLSKRLTRLRSKIPSVVEVEGVEVGNEMSSDLWDIVSEESPSVEALPEDSFRKLFWEQQQAALSKKKTAMRWHPLMNATPERCHKR